MINVAHVEKVTKNGKLKDMAGKGRQIAHAATLTFNVRWQNNLLSYTKYALRYSD